MSRNRTRNKLSFDTRRDGGGFIALPWQVMDSKVYLTLSHPAKSLLLEIARQYSKDNNGRLLASRAHLKKRGWNSSDTIYRALRELIEAKLIHQTVMGHRPNKASWFALTWYHLDRHSSFDAGAYESFRRGSYADLPVVKITKFRPIGGTESPVIAPRDGLESIPLVPAEGAIKPLLRETSTPLSGHHLDITIYLTNKEPTDGVKTKDKVTTRVRDSDFDPNHFDPETGEFHKQPPLAPAKQRATAQSWVHQALDAKTG